MNKFELIDEISSVCYYECSKACAELALEVILNPIMKGLKRDGRVLLIGFSRFSVSESTRHIGVNPKTKTSKKITASRTFKFNVDSEFK